MTQELKLFVSKEELIDSAKAQSLKAPAEFVTATYYYFIARYYVAVFESRFAHIPIQVWNEYRNALDHFFRFQTTEDKDSSNQIKKMEGHLLRATLDVLKIFCHKSLEDIEKEFSKHDLAILSLVDNGGYLTELTLNKNKAQECFELAKTQDSRLGNLAIEDITILELYLDSAMKLDNIILSSRVKQESVNKAYLTHTAITNQASNHSTKHHLLVHGLFYIIKYGVFLIAGALLTYFWEPHIKPLFISATTNEGGAIQSEQAATPVVEAKTEQEIPLK